MREYIYSNIELIYSDNTHLSDKVSSGNATEDEKKVFELIDKAEKSMIQNQTFLLNEELVKCKIGKVEFLRLNNLLKQNEL